MYQKSCYQYQWYNPRYNNWNQNNWCNNWNPNYYNWSNINLNPYGNIILRDYGPKPFVVNIDQAAKQNKTYRTALWTGKHFQVTLMSINVGEDIGLEVHPATDQFIRIEEGQGLVQMGDSKNKLDFQERAYDDYAIMIPAGKWHNITNTGHIPLKIYVIYAPPEHPYGTVHETKAIAMAAE
ncbi:cupin domain-containing protein [Paenibacillus lignilyticus]|uniref:Cupin domain-containing protein n=1 Tax=Paenibacillus lignilyticus TaxID=1172615 RepID=A0ABS5C9B2_9BACL|nr:cupin domain-containing protein [Paenibacillus lignilyticus]MBP3962589.1 cupin domain-containing protein [Paenibacillus lignilyticus]